MWKEKYDEAIRCFPKVCKSAYKLAALKISHLSLHYHLEAGKMITIDAETWSCISLSVNAWIKSKQLLWWRHATRGTEDAFAKHISSNTYRKGKICRSRFTLQQNIKKKLDEIKREGAE